MVAFSKARATPTGERRKYRCRWTDGDLLRTHYFTHPAQLPEVPPEVAARRVADRAVRRVLDRAVAPPICPRVGHQGHPVSMYGSYMTASGPRQRYACYDAVTGEFHTFSAVLPRTAVDDDTRCADCDVLIPRNAGAESVTRRLNYPAEVVFQVLRDLANGIAYTTASMSALTLMGRTTGRSRRIAESVLDANGDPMIDRHGKPIERMVEVDELNDAGRFSPEREQKAHWHIAADILERFAPVVTVPAFEDIARQEAKYRARGLPVVYFADEVDIKRDYARSATQTSSPMVWSALVVSRTKWQHDDIGNVVGRSGHLVRFRAMPNRTAEAWTLVFRELPAPDYLIADGASAIAAAAARVWAGKTTVVPCVYHATANIQRRLTPRGAKAPQKLRDHMFLLTRKNLGAGGPAAVKAWFDGLEAVAAAEPLPLDVVASLRTMYQPLLQRAARVAQTQNSPEVAISNASVEKQIEGWVKQVTRMRGPLYANWPRTNLLGDLVVAGSNGALLDRHQVIHAIRDAARAGDGWVPRPRALVEPAGAMSLRDSFSVTELLTRLGVTS